MALVCLEGLLNKGFNIVGVIGPKKNHDTYNMFKDFVKARKLKYIEYDKLDEKNLIKQIKDLKPDIAVVCSFNYKIPKVMLDSVPAGFINVHPSLLPKYRGANPYSAPIINGEKETGITLHFMDTEFDTGDIILQRKISISPKETMGTLFNRFNIMALDMLVETLNKFEKENTLPRTKQPEGNFVKAPAIYENETFIDFQKSAIETDRFIRGLNPFIVAKTYLRQTPVKIFSAEFSTQNFEEGLTGQVIEIKANEFYIKTGSGVIIPTALQFGSFFAGNAKDFIQILGLKIGERFGS